MGMVPPLPLPFYVIVWSSPVLMTWYIVVSIFIYGAESGHYNAIGTFGIHRLSSTSGCFCIIWLFGDGIEILRTGFAGNYVVSV